VETPNPDRLKIESSKPATQICHILNPTALNPKPSRQATLSQASLSLKPQVLQASKHATRASQQERSPGRCRAKKKQLKVFSTFA
jgi:hypothetical protein